MNNLPKIIDNDRRSLFSVLDMLSTEYETLSIATWYRDLPWTALLIDKFLNYKKIRLLIWREPLINRYQLEKPEPDFPDKDIFDDLESMWFKPEFKETIEKIKQLKDQWILEVKVYTKSFLHAKCYIFGNYESDHAVWVIGSSNFTHAWLTKNTELNALESDHRIVTFQPQSETQEVGHLYWFDQFRHSDGALDWTGKFTELLEQSAHGDLLFSPYEMYIKVLYDLYHEELFEEWLTWDHSEWMYQLATFQNKNVQLLKRKLKKYKTALLCDSVWLWKTIQGIWVIKEYLHDEDGTKKRICVICPKSLKEQWKQDLWDSGIVPTSIEVITLQNSLEIEKHKEIDKRAWVKLFVIDESHNLRKSSGKRYEQLLEWISNNLWAHVLMLTATPINNEISDLVNQILLWTRWESSIIKVHDDNFVKTIDRLKKKINKQKRNDEEIDFEEVRQIISPILRSVVVRRTRQGIMQEYGWVEINGNLITFPVSTPEQYTYEFDTAISKKLLQQTSSLFTLEQLYRADPEEYIDKCTDLKHPLRQLDKIEWQVSLNELVSSPLFFTFQLILSLGFIPYRRRIYQKKFYWKTVEQIKALKLPGDESRQLQQQRGIYGIFRTIFLKRLESSIASFEISLETYEQKLQHFQDGVKHNQIVSVKWSADKLRLLYTDDDELDEIEIEEEDGVLDTLSEIWYEKEILIEDITWELELIRLLKEHVVLLKQHDPKLEALKGLIKQLRENEINGGKVLVFSYFADTITYLRETLGRETSLFGWRNVWFVSSSNRAEADILSKRFSPRSKRYEGNESQIDYLFATDVLSEWQNLQDCWVVINYDLHRNPVRMIQRNGRINRLGSQWDRVYIYNMHPATKIEAYLRLVNRLENKIAVINATIGNDQSVLWEIANPIEFVDTIADLYSDDEQKRMRALESIEEEADLLAVDDQFISDLKVFDKNPDHTLEYKHTIYNIPKQKRWICIHKASTGDEEHYSPDYLVLWKLFDADGGFMDFRAYGALSWNKTTLWLIEFLNIIRSTAEENSRQKDTLILDKIAIATESCATTNYIFQKNLAKLKPSQNKILESLFEYHFDIDAVDVVEKAFLTTNYLHQKKMEKYRRNIIRAINAKENPVNLIKDLIAFSNRVVDDQAEELPPSSAQGYLFFAKQK
jgi:superfamily II DNA or RNA helicase